jgi:hypothetical protein
MQKLKRYIVVLKVMGSEVTETIEAASFDEAYWKALKQFGHKSLSELKEDF